MILSINNTTYEVDVDLATPLLWVIREQVGLTGTKFGCGIGQCGSCTVQLDGVAIRSCLTPVQSAEGKEITTIEGIAHSETELHAIQEAWIEEQIPQCGYCQSGQIVAVHALLTSNATPTDDEIDEAMSGNVCRCGTYPRVRKGIKRAAAEMTATANTKNENHGEMD